MDEKLKAAIDHWREEMAVRKPGQLNTELTVDDWEVIAQDVWNRFTPEDSIVLHIYDVFKREFTKGHRCSVCGRTQLQNEEIGYDCFREC